MRRVLLFIAATCLLGVALHQPKTTEQTDVLESYFVSNRTHKGLVLDRESDRDTVSVAATGFGMDCWAIAARNGTMSRAKALQWVNEAIDNTMAKNPEKNRGWLYHFTDAEGVPKSYSEVSTIDSAIFYLGARQAARRLGDETLMKKVEGLIRKVDTSIVMTDDGYFYHGFQGGRHIECFWDELNEGVMLYQLFGKPFRPKRIDYDLPLFVFYYPMCFSDDPEMVDHLRRAVTCQKARYGHWGLTATDGPDGYEVGNISLVSPLAIWSVKPYIPEAEDTLALYPVPRSTCSYHVRTGWKSKDKIGIDYGCAMILLNKP